MALETYTGRVTDFSRKAFNTAQQLDLRVVPTQAGFGGGGLLSDREIPVSVATNGDFTFQLEGSTSVRPVAEFALEARWLDSQAKSWSRWAVFRAAAGGGNIKDIVSLPAPPGSIAYGFGPPPSDFRGGFYLDISGTKPVLWVPEGSAL